MAMQSLPIPLFIGDNDKPKSCSTASVLNELEGKELCLDKSNS